MCQYLCDEYKYKNIYTIHMMTYGHYSHITQVVSFASNMMIRHGTANNAANRDSSIKVTINKFMYA